MLGLVLINHNNLPINLSLIDEAEAAQHLSPIDAAQLLLRLAEIANIDRIIIPINNINHTYNPSESFTIFCYQV